MSAVCAVITRPLNGAGAVELVAEELFVVVLDEGLVDPLVLVPALTVVADPVKDEVLAAVPSELHADIVTATKAATNDSCECGRE